VSAGWSTDRAMLAILAVGNRGKLRGLASSVKSLCIMSTLWITDCDRGLFYSGKKIMEEHLSKMFGGSISCLMRWIDPRG